MATNPKTFTCEECGNHHDPAYSDCATGDPILPSVAPPEIRSTDGLDAEAETARKYQELIYAVESKHAGETRHETALRYIRQAETHSESAQASNVGDMARLPAQPR